MRTSKAKPNYWLLVGWVMSVLTYGVGQAEEIQSTYFCGKANPAEAASVEQLVDTIYQIVSGPKAQPRNWQLFRQLFSEQAKIGPVNRNQQGQVRVRIGSVDDFIELSSRATQQAAFYESKVAEQVIDYGQITQVASSYQARRAPDAEPFIEGVNFIQLVNDGRRWCVVSLIWDAGHPLPSW